MSTQTLIQKSKVKKIELTFPKVARTSTREEMDDKRKMGLCMWCGVKYTFGHKCVRSKVYLLLVEESDELLQEVEGATNCMDKVEEVLKDDVGECLKLVISLYAFLGTRDSQITRLHGSIKNHFVILLVDIILLIKPWSNK